MADPPPPSYNDVITGDYSSPPGPYSSPPDPSSSPPSFTPIPPHLSPSSVLIPDRTLSPSSENIVYTQTRLTSAPSERQRLSQLQVTDDPDDQSSSSVCKSKKFQKIACIVILCIVIISILSWMLSPNKRYDSPELDEEDTSQSGPHHSVLCQNLLQLPEISEPLFPRCPTNLFGSYDMGAKCDYHCLANKTLFGKNENKEWIDLKSTSFSAFCDGDSKWFVKVSFNSTNDFRATICGEETIDTIDCVSHHQKLQCLQHPNPLNCRDPPPNISNSTWSRCLRNVYGTYLEGQSCSFKCKSGYVLSSSKGPLDGDTNYETSGVYKCSEKKWVNQDGSNKPLQCLTLTDFIIQDIG